MQPQRTALRSVQCSVGNAVADAERPAVGLDHGPVAGVVNSESHPQHGPGRGIGPCRPRHRLYLVGLSRHVFARGFRHLAGALGGHRPLLARIAVEQGIARPAPRHPGHPPGQADRIENSGVEAERPHRRNQMCGIAHQEHPIPPPLRRDAVVDAIDDGVEDFHLVDRTDETDHLVAEFVRARLRNPGGQRIEKTPAVRLADQDHPFLRVGEIGEIRVVARIGHVEIDFHIDQQATHIGQFAFHGDAELRAHRAAPTVAGQEVRALDVTVAVGRLETLRPRHRRSVETTSGDAADGAHRAGADRWHRAGSARGDAGAC